MRKKFVSCACLLLTMLLLLFSCGSKEPKEPQPGGETGLTDTSSADAGNLLRIVDHGASDYTVVYSHDVSEAVFLKIQDLIASIKSVTGAELPVRQLGKDEHISGDFPAIVIGKTACGEMQKELRRNDYILCISGTNLMINAHEDTELLKALTYFCQKLLRTSYQNGVFTLDENFEYYRAAEYILDSMSLLNTGIEEYRVVIPQNYTPFEYYAASLVWDHLTSATGFYIDFVTDEQPASEHEILVGNTNRHTEALGSYEYAIGTERGSVWMAASDLYSYGALADYVTRELFYTEEDSLQLNAIPETRRNIRSALADMQRERYGDLRVLFNNILGNCDQILYPVARRNEMLAEIYKSYDPDVIGLQECSANSRSLSYSSIIKLLEEAGYAEVPVTGCSGNLYTPVLYQRDRFELVDSGYLLYSLNVKKDNSKSLVWAVLERKESGERFAVISTHFTVYGSDEYPAENARVENSTELLQAVQRIYAQYSCPVIIGGDLNCPVSSDAMKLLLQNGSHARYAAPITDTVKTSHGYPTFSQELGIYVDYAAPKSNAADESIDHICFFYEDSVTINAFDVCADQYACLASDHCPIIVDFTFKNIS